MKDKQTEATSGQSRIPFVSATLHCISMPAVVYLRSSFGFAYLRPKSVFFAFTWAFALFSIYACTEPETWRRYRATCILGAGAVLLYWTHLIVAFMRELYRRGEHDHYSGTSHLVRLAHRIGSSATPNLELNVQLWTEPVIILVAAAFVWFRLDELRLAEFIAFTAACLGFKEAFNYWFHLRQKKRQADMFEDTGETVDSATAGTGQTAPTSGRTQKKKRPRNAGEETAKEHRFAEILRLLPPYSLDHAEVNYQRLIKLVHPDATGTSAASNARATDLNEAIQFFRDRSSGKTHQA